MLQVLADNSDGADHGEVAPTTLRSPAEVDVSQACGSPYGPDDEVFPAFRGRAAGRPRGSRVRRARGERKSSRFDPELGGRCTMDDMFTPTAACWLPTAGRARGD